jgi:uncharacterized protein (DUF427 family)
LIVARDPQSPGQESVWDYPRPPIAVPCEKRIVIVHRGVTIADTTNAIRTLETSHPPTYYLPPEDILMSALQPVDGSSFCEWKGHARYFDVFVERQRLTKALRDYIAFYAQSLDACLVGGEQVKPQPGGFYGGWITSDVSGPFKGIPGSGFW